MKQVRIFTRLASSHLLSPKINICDPAWTEHSTVLCGYRRDRAVAIVHSRSIMVDKLLKVLLLSATTVAFVETTLPLQSDRRHVRFARSVTPVTPQWDTEYWMCVGMYHTHIKSTDFFMYCNTIFPEMVGC